MKKLSEDEIIVRLKEIIGGCRSVKEDRSVHQDAKDLATAVIRDCNKTIANIRGERLPGDDDS